MKKYTYPIVLLILVAFTSSCKKSYECDCTTVTSNNSGPGSTSMTTKDTYVSPGHMTRKNAENWCNANDQQGEVGGGEHISTTCVLTGR